MTNNAYFAYGSNMSRKQMYQRCPNSQFEGIGILENYELCFPIISQKRNNAGVASIRKKDSSKVEGILYQISDDEIIIMDGFEGKNYYRTKLDVLFKNEIVTAYTYIAIDNESTHKIPSQEYMDIILSGAYENGLSKEYIDFLKKFETR